MYQSLVWSAFTSTAVPEPTWMRLSAFTAKTSPSTIPDGIDRSMPAVAITNVVPTLTTVRIETFSASSWMFVQVLNLPGAMREKTTVDDDEEEERHQHRAGDQPSDERRPGVDGHPRTFGRCDRGRDVTFGAGVDGGNRGLA